MPRALARKSPRTSRAVRIARATLAVLATFSADVSAAFAAAAFRRPPRYPRTRGETRTLEIGTASRIATPEGSLALWTWGEGPMVLLVHGWGGHAGRLSRFVGPLVEAGFGVAAFDAPAHGDSAGRLASLPDFVESVRRIAGVCRPVGMVGHSMGAAACALAVRTGVRARGLVLLSTPRDPAVYTRRFARYLRLPVPVADSMDEKLQRRYGVTFEDLRLEGALPEVPAIFFHDRGDGRVPLRDGRAIAQAWPASELIETRGLGHHKILRDSQVIARAVEFLAAVATAGAGPRRAGRERHAS